MGRDPKTESAGSMQEAICLVKAKSRQGNRGPTPRGFPLASRRNPKNHQELSLSVAPKILSNLSPQLGGKAEISDKPERAEGRFGAKGGKRGAMGHQRDEPRLQVYGQQDVFLFVVLHPLQKRRRKPCGQTEVLFAWRSACSEQNRVDPLRA